MKFKEVIYQEEDSKFIEMKKLLQSILDKRLPAKYRFSVESFDKEDVYNMCRLLLEKDDVKRNYIWKELDKKRKNSIEQFLLDLNDIERKKAELDNYLWVSNDLNILFNDVVVDEELKKSVNDF